MAVIIGGNDWAVITLALTTVPAQATYNKQIKNFLVSVRGNSNVLMRRNQADSAYLTIKNGGNLPFALPIADSSAATASLGWYATDAGTDTLEIIVIF